MTEPIDSAREALLWLKVGAINACLEQAFRAGDNDLCEALHDELIEARGDLIISQQWHLHEGDD